MHQCNTLSSTLSHTHPQVHVSSERRGQEVCTLIERPHGATVTLKVWVFISERCETLLCYRWCTWNKWQHMEENSVYVHGHSHCTKDGFILKHIWKPSLAKLFTPCGHFSFVLFPLQTKLHPSTHWPHRQFSFNLGGPLSYSFPPRRPLPSCQLPCLPPSCKLQLFWCQFTPQCKCSFRGA